MMTREEICEAFEIDSSALRGARIVYAEYSREDYEGWAAVLFRRGGKLYLVEASHCSCYGLEGQWSPVETSKAELILRKDNLATVARRLYS